MEYNSKRAHQHISSGCIVLDSELSLSKRIHILYQDIQQLIDKYRPQELALESVFFAKNAQSAIKLGQARGVVLLAAESASLEIAEYTPTEVKLSISSTGRAEKDQIQHMVRILLKLGKNFDFESSDHADALAICLTHVQTRLSNTRRSYDRPFDRKNPADKSHPFGN